MLGDGTSDEDSSSKFLELEIPCGNKTQHNLSKPESENRNNKSELPSVGSRDKKGGARVIVGSRIVLLFQNDGLGIEYNSFANQP